MPPPHRFHAQEKKFDLDELLKSYIDSSETRIKNQKASIKNLENQVG